MLRMCRPIFGSGKAVVLDSVFCVAKGITELKDKVVYVGALIKKRHYWPKWVPGELSDTNIEDKEVVDVRIFGARTQDNKSFIIFCMKEPDHEMKIMDSWMDLDELEGTNTRKDFIYSNRKKETNKFAFRKSFGIHFRYIHQVDNHNNRWHAPIYLERTRATKFWPDINFYWHLGVSEVNTALSQGHF